MQVDYIVVGLGLAGIALCEQLRSHNKSFVVIDQPQSSASTVASGLYNPIVLKRFVPAWKGHELMQRSLPYYKKLEKKLKTSFIHSTSILRRFTAPSELNDWQHACSSLGMASYMDPLLKTNTNIDD
jgi:flavin-dependent dehydrogenase